MTLLQHELTDFKVNAFQNNELNEVTKDDVLGHWSLFFFYPADFTFICPTELEDLADNYDTFKKLGCEIYAVSTDSHFTHMAWHSSSPAVGKVKFPMIGDPTLTISRNFGVLIEADGMAERGTFLINPEGQIVVIELHNGNIGRDAKELLRKLEAAQYVAAHPGEVCPARWTPGAKTLKPGADLVGKI